MMSFISEFLVTAILLLLNILVLHEEYVSHRIFCGNLVFWSHDPGLQVGQYMHGVDLLLFL